ncbi:MAG TPA: hypothetical protein VIT44_18800 [Cyclobacteriaceae bacterium]
MRKIFASKTVMMVADVLAAFLIVLSQSFYHQAKEKVAKAKSEQKADDNAQTFISAPNDAVSQTNIVQLDDQVPSLKESLLSEEKQAVQPVIKPEVFARYFKVLFRAIISPNAP